MSEPLAPADPWRVEKGWWVRWDEHTLSWVRVRRVRESDALWSERYSPEVGDAP